VALVAGTALLAVGVVANGIARVSAGAAPGTALAVAPWDARALAGEATARLTEDPAAPDLDGAAAAARRALARDLTVASAFGTLGTVRDARGDRAGAARLMAASSRVSRRDLATRLWFIETAVQRGDVAGALQHFDIALRTNRSAAPLLFPILGGALTDDALVRPIARLLAREPAWAAEFVYATASSGVASTNLARALALLPRLPQRPGTDLRAMVVEALVAEGAFAAGRAFAAPAMPPQPSGALLRDPRFADPRGVVPFTWGLADSADLSAERLGGGGGVRVSATNNGRGRALRQALALAPGAYRFTTLREGSPIRSSEAPVWSVLCVARGGAQRVIAALPVAGPGRAAMGFVIPQGCAAQFVALDLPANEAPNGIEFVVREATITRAG
jgi:hypothetical protein